VRGGRVSDGADRPIRGYPFPRGMRQNRVEPDDASGLIDRGIVWTVAISCWLKVFRTISSPLDSGAYRKDRSTAVDPSERIVPTNDFSGLTSCACALASAAAIVPIVSLERCMTTPRIEQVEADGT
jgi:hypothetical protein